MAACGGKGLSWCGVLGLAWQIMGVDRWRSKCDYDGKKRERREVGLGVGGAGQEHKPGRAVSAKKTIPPVL